MKKLVLAATAALVMASFITSCSKENGSCYHVKYTVPEQPEQKDSTGTVTRAKQKEFKFDGYKWMSSSEVSACKSNWETMGYKDISVEAASEFKTKAACLYTED